jgi:hypothetical protein
VTSAKQTNLAAREIATTLCDEPDRSLPPVSHVKHLRQEVERTPLGVSRTRKTAGNAA